MSETKSLPSIHSPVQPASDLHEIFVDRVDAIMSFAEAIPWGKRWAARIPNVIGYTIEADHVAALAELRKEVIADLEGVATRLRDRIWNESVEQLGKERGE